MEPADPTLDRAFGYPYARPRGDFCFDAESGTAVPLNRLDAAGRLPVLAVGSNAAPEQLARKFTPGTGAGTIPVTTARLVDHDVVFAAHLTGYGACPATLVRCEDVAASVHVTWLTAAQVEHMDATEAVHGARPAYRRIEVAAADVQFDPLSGTPDPPAVVWAYEATAGALWLDSAPCALAAVPAVRRVWPAVDERTVLSRVAELLGVSDAETMVLTAVRDVATRRHWNRRLARFS